MAVEPQSRGDWRKHMGHTNLLVRAVALMRPDPNLLLVKADEQRIIDGINAQDFVATWRAVEARIEEVCAGISSDARLRLKNEAWNMLSHAGEAEHSPIAPVHQLRALIAGALASGQRCCGDTQ